MAARNTFSWSAIVAAALVVTIGLAGCVGGGSTEKSTPKPSPTITNTDTGDLKNPVGAFADLKGFSCAPKGATWSAKGQLVNGQKSAQTYYVSVAVVQTEGSGVVGNVWSKITVKAGASKEFAFRNVAKSDSQALQCVPRVVRAKA